MIAVITALLIMIGGGAILALAMQLERLRGQLADLRIEYESEQAWADQYCRQAEQAEQALADLHRHYAALLWLHDGDAMLTHAAAWRMGLRKVRRA